MREKLETITMKAEGEAKDPMLKAV